MNESCYVAFAPCGCVTLITIADSRSSKSVSKCIKRGDTVELKPLSWLRDPNRQWKTYGDCDVCSELRKKQPKKSTKEAA